MLVGGFYLYGTSKAERPINDSCEDAIEIRPQSLNLGFGVEGSTLEAVSDGLSLCGENIVMSPGIWYLYESSEEKVVVQASTCADKTDFDTALTVYSGSCPNLKCIDGKDDDFECGLFDVHSTISWHAEINTRYYILVHGSEANHTGNFELTITTDTPAPPSNNSGASMAAGACLSLAPWLSIIVGLLLIL